jgi:hypothetical protein
MWGNFLNHYPFKAAIVPHNNIYMEVPMILYRGTARVKRPVPDYIYDRLPQGQRDAFGRWFTNELEIAQWYADDAGDGGKILTVEVPEDVALSSWLPNQPKEVQRFSRDLQHEFFLPREWADRAQE